MYVCLIRLSWFYYTEFDTIVRPRARCTLPRIHDETRKIHGWCGATSSSHRILRGAVCVSHGMTDQSESDRYSFKYTMRTYTVL